MRNIHEQQDHASNGLDVHISRESGDRDTGIRSQVELEAQIDDLKAQNEVLVSECRQAVEQYQDALESNSHNEEKIKEMSEQLRQASAVISQQQKETLRIKGELCDYLEQVVRHQQAEIQHLKTRSDAMPRDE